ncbi:50S ribosomal protein L22 [bacterium]|nr:50S ribosomal protein L22 [bacterium]MBU1754205.1 50S ribosomal protein L22 [bacterium]
MEAMAQAKYLRISSRKLRQVMDVVRGKSVDSAVNILKFLPKKAARLIEKVLIAAVANARQKQANLDKEDLYIKTIYADAGTTLKRWLPRCFGRANRIRKRTSQITIVVEG